MSLERSQGIVEYIMTFKLKHHLIKLLFLSNRILFNLFYINIL